MLTFAYTEKTNAKGVRFYLPEVPTALRLPNGNYTPTIPVLLDTGGDRTHLPSQLAGMLGIDLAECEALSMVFANGKTTVFAPPGDWAAVVSGYVAPIRPVFGDDFGGAVLGREVFESFRATFDGRARTVTLDPFSDLERVE